MVMSETCQWIGKNIVRSADEKKLQESIESYIGSRDMTEIMLKNVVKHYTINQPVNLRFCLNAALFCWDLPVVEDRDPSREKGPYGNCEKYRPWSAWAVRAG